MAPSPSCAPPTPPTAFYSNVVIALHGQNCIGTASFVAGHADLYHDNDCVVYGTERVDDLFEVRAVCVAPTQWGPGDLLIINACGSLKTARMPLLVCRVYRRAACHATDTFTSPPPRRTATRTSHPTLRCVAGITGTTRLMQMRAQLATVVVCAPLRSSLQASPITSPPPGCRRPRRSSRGGGRSFSSPLDGCM